MTIPNDSKLASNSYIKHLVCKRSGLQTSRFLAHIIMDYELRVVVEKVSVTSIAPIDKQNPKWNQLKFLW